MVTIAFDPPKVPTTFAITPGHKRASFDPALLTPCMLGAWPRAETAEYRNKIKCVVRLLKDLIARPLLPLLDYRRPRPKSPDSGHRGCPYPELQSRYELSRSAIPERRRLPQSPFAPPPKPILNGTPPPYCPPP